jgi:hypothetical protein
MEETSGASAQRLVSSIEIERARKAGLFVLILGSPQGLKILLWDGFFTSLEAPSEQTPDTSGACDNRPFSNMLNAKEPGNPGSWF